MTTFKAEIEKEVIDIARRKRVNNQDFFTLLHPLSMMLPPDIKLINGCKNTEIWSIGDLQKAINKR